MVIDACYLVFISACCTHICCNILLVYESWLPKLSMDYQGLMMHGLKYQQFCYCSNLPCVLLTLWPLIY